jgi:hypothetical protein
MKRLLISTILLVAVALAWKIPPTNATITGGVTAVRAGYGLTLSEDPLVDTGTIIWDSTGFKAWYNAGTTADSITKGVVKATRVRAATIYTTNIFPTAATTHLLFALTASTSLDSVRFKATVVRVDSLDAVAVHATQLRGDSTISTVSQATRGRFTTAYIPTVSGSMTNSDTSFHNGYVGLGNYMTDYIAVYGQTLTRNTGGTSNWVDIYRPDSLVRGSFWHSASKIRGLGGTGQFNQVFINAEMDTATTTFSLRGAEIKGTSKVTMSGTSQLIGAYLKTSIGGSSATTAWSTPCYSILATDATNTLTLGYNFYAENSVAGTVTASAIMGVHPTNNTWTYGLDFNSATFSTADWRMGKGATIYNNHADTLTVTEANIKLVGKVDATSLLVGGTATTLVGFCSNGDSTGIITLTGATTDTAWVHNAN